MRDFVHFRRNHATSRVLGSCNLSMTSCLLVPKGRFLAPAATVRIGFGAGVGRAEGATPSKWPP